MFKITRTALTLLAISAASAFSAQAVDVDPEWNALSKTGWSISGCSAQNHQQGNDGPLSEIIDDDITTYWHTSWSGSADNNAPHFFVIDRGENPTDVFNAFGFTPKQANGGNGFVQQYELYLLDNITGLEVAEEGTNGTAVNNTNAHASLESLIEGQTPAISGNLGFTHSGSHDEARVTLSATHNERYILFVVKTANGENGSITTANCAEFTLYNAPEKTYAQQLDEALPQEDAFFSYVAEGELANTIADIKANPSNYTQEQVDNVVVQIQSLPAKLKDEIKLDITDGSKVTFRNVATDRASKPYICSAFFAENAHGANNQWGACRSADMTWTTFWELKSAGSDEGNNQLWYIYNEMTEKYIGNIPGTNNHLVLLADTEATAGKYYITKPAADSEYVVMWQSGITTTCNDGIVNAIHMGSDWDGTCRWARESPGSQYTMTEVTEETIKQCSTNLINEAKNAFIDRIGFLPYSIIENAVTELQSNDTDISKARALYSLMNAEYTTDNYMRPENNKYYTIRGAHPDNVAKYITEDYGNLSEGFNKARAIELGSNIAPALWQFVSCTDEGNTDLYHITAANSNGVFRKSLYGQTLTVVTPDHENAGKYDIMNKDHRSNGGVTLVSYTENRGDRGTASISGDQIQSWNAVDNNNCWVIELVEEVPVTLNEEGYAAVHFPFAVLAPEEDFAVYQIIKVSADKAQLSKVSAAIPANTPVILKGTANENVNLTIDYNGAPAPTADEAANETPTTPNVIQTENVTMQGALVPTEAPANAYVLSGNKLVPATEGIAANSSYIVANLDGEKALTTDDISTGIEEVGVEGNGAAEWFDLNGRRVANPAKGLYIKRQGGKATKTIIR